MLRKVNISPIYKDVKDVKDVKAKMSKNAKEHHMFKLGQDKEAPICHKCLSFIAVSPNKFKRLEPTQR